MPPVTDITSRLGRNAKFDAPLPIAVDTLASRSAFPDHLYARWLHCCRRLTSAGYGDNVVSGYVNCAPSIAKKLGPEIAFDLADAVSAIAAKTGKLEAAKFPEAALFAANKLSDQRAFRAWVNLIERFAAIARESVLTLLENMESHASVSPVTRSCPYFALNAETNFLFAALSRLWKYPISVRLPAAFSRPIPDTSACSVTSNAKPNSARNSFKVFAISLMIEGCIPSVGSSSRKTFGTLRESNILWDRGTEVMAHHGHNQVFDTCLGVADELDFQVQPTNFDIISNQLNSTNYVLTFGIVFILVGLAFKISAVPFHMWAPDVYEGSPTSVTLFFTMVPKIAALTVFIRFLYVPFLNLIDQWQMIIIFLSIASMLFGAIAAIGQTNIKRLIAYSSIGHIGYTLAGLATGSNEGIQSSIVYITIYVIMNLAFFSCLLMLKRNNQYYEDIDDLSGLSKNHPLLSLSLLIILFSLAGIPPLAGFFAKFYIFKAVLEQSMYFLAIVGLLSTVIAAFYYLRVIKIIYFDKEKEKYQRNSNIVQNQVISDYNAFYIIQDIISKPNFVTNESVTGPVILLDSLKIKNIELKDMNNPLLKSPDLSFLPFPKSFSTSSQPNYCVAFFINFCF